MHRVAGRADGGAVPDREQRPQLVQVEPGRHRDPGVVADPGQRERRLPRDQRPDPAGARTSCTRATPRCTSPATPAPASSSTATTSCGRATSCRCTARSATCVANAALAVRPASRRARRPRRGRRRRRPRRRRRGRRRGAVRLRLRRRVERRRRSPRSSSRTAGSSARRASSRSSSWSTRRPARCSRARRSTPAAFAEDDTVFDEIRAASPRRWTRPRRGHRRHLPAAAGHAPRRRPLGQRQAPPPPDDHPGRRRGLTPRKGARVRATGHSRALDRALAFVRRGASVRAKGHVRASESAVRTSRGRLRMTQLTLGTTYASFRRDVRDASAARTRPFARTRAPLRGWGQTTPTVTTLPLGRELPPSASCSTTVSSPM